MGKIGIFRRWLDLECEGWGEGGVTIEGMGKEEVVGLHWVGGEQEATDSDGGEVIRSFKDGWAGVSTLGMTIAGDEAGNVVFDEALVEVCEQVAETLVGPATVAREQADEWVKYDEPGVDALDGLEEGGEILRDGKGMMAAGVRFWGGLLNVGEKFDAGEIGS